MDLRSVDDFFPNYANDENVVHLNQLTIEDNKEILEDMRDWETYMYCKEAYERSNANANLIEDMPLVRCSGIIRFEISDEQSRAKDLAYGIGNSSYSNNYASNKSYSYDYSALSNFSNVEIRSRENWDECGERNQEEEERKTEEARLQKAMGNDAYASGDYKKACEHYSNCIAYGINRVDAYNNRAQANIRLNNFVSAIPDLNEVLEVDPKNEKALFRRARCRKQLKMYREALKDLEDLLTCNAQSSSAKRLKEEIENIVPTLKGKSYRLRENFRNRETFQVNEIQLPAYAEANRECLDYLIEIDKTGCLKSCVCHYCSDEDRLSSQSSNSLRIGNRPRWAPITFKLLDEMKIVHNSVTNSANLDVSLKEKTTINKNDPTAETNEVQFGKFSSSTNEVKRWMPQQFSGKRVEHLMRDLKVANNVSDAKHPRVALKQIRPRLVKKVYGDALNGSVLTNMMNSICTDFDHTKEWNLLSEYLKEIARLRSFDEYIKLVDKRTRNDVSNVLESASQQNLADADDLKRLYSQ